MSYFDPTRGVYYVAGSIEVTEELLRDADPRWLDAMLEEHLDRVFRPWLFPDPNPMPYVTPFPLLARAILWYRRRHGKHTHH